MNTNKRWQQTMRLPIAVQAKHLRDEYPEGRLIANHKRLKWLATVSAHPCSLQYKIQLEYALNYRSPKVIVIEPNLRTISNGKQVPHLFSQEKQTLCLHYHGVWKPSNLIAETIVPWTVLWTEYFEWWLATGDWDGDEVAHSEFTA